MIRKHCPSGDSNVTVRKELNSWYLYIGVNLKVQDLLRQDAGIQDLNFNISEMKLSIASLYIISDSPKYDIIWTENSDVIDSFISEIFKYKSWILASWRKDMDRETPLCPFLT